MATKKSSKKPIKAQSKKPAMKQTKKVTKKEGAIKKAKEKSCWDYSPEEWIKKENKRIEQEFKKYAPDLKPNSGQSTKQCARTAMTLAHHGTKKALETLKQFKKDPRAPMWIDCAIEECEMILWDDTVGKQLEKAEEELRKAAEKVMAEKLIWDKNVSTNALKVILTQQKTKFTYGKTAKLYYKNKVIGEDKLEFVIAHVLLVGIKPSFADWLMRFKEGLEGKDLRKGDLENIEQAALYDEDGSKLEEPKSLQEGFDEFYEQQFYNLLQMSKKPQGILLDFSGNKLYGKYFSLPHESGWFSDGCSGWCEGCLQELKCETAQEWKREDDKRRYRTLKQLIKEIIEIEEKINTTKQPLADLEYKIKTAEKIRNNIQEKIKKEKGKSRRLPTGGRDPDSHPDDTVGIPLSQSEHRDVGKRIKQLEEEMSNWDCEIVALGEVLNLEQPSSDIERLKTLKEMYQTIKQEIETEEYKNDVEGLEVYYGKAEPKLKDGPNFYHDPLCECDKYEESLNTEESIDEYKNNEEIDEIPTEEIPF